MRFQRLDLTNWRAIVHKELDFGAAPLALILGDNASGKTSICHAMRWLLTGRCPGLDKGGRGVSDFARHGMTHNDQMSVSGLVHLKGETLYLTRKWSGTTTSFEVKGWRGSTTEQEAAWFQRVGVSREVLTTVLDGEFWLRLAHGDAKALLLDLLHAEIVVPAEVAKRPTETITLDECELRYQQWFQARANLKRDLKNLPVVAPPTIPLSDREDIKKRLAKVRTDRDALIAQRAASVGDQASVEREFTTLSAELSTLLAQVTQLGTFDGVVYPEPLAAAQSKREALADEATSLQTQADLLATELDSMTVPADQSYAVLMALAEKMKAFVPSEGCVLHASVKCPQKATAFAKAAKDLDRDAHAVKGAHEARVTLEGRLSELRMQAENRQRQTTTWDQRIEQIGHLLEHKDVLISKMDELSPRLPDTTTGPSPLDEQIDTCDARIAKGEEILKKAEQTAREHTAFRQFSDTKLGLTKQIEEAEAQVTFYGPTGVRVASLTAAMSGLEASINKYTRPFDFRFELSIEPWDVRINRRSIETYSESERLRIVAALQIAMAQASGIGMTILDRLDLLLKNASTTLQTQLLFPSGLEQIVVAKAFEPGLPTPVLDPAKIHVVRMGAFNG